MVLLTLYLSAMVLSRNIDSRYSTYLDYYFFITLVKLVNFFNVNFS